MEKKKKKLLKDVEFKWIPFERHYELNRYNCCRHCWTSIVDKKWLINFLKVESLYLGVNVYVMWVRVKRLSRTYIDGDFVLTDVTNDSIKLFLNWTSLDCEYCLQFICTIGDSDYEFVKEETNFYLDRTDFTHFYLVKIIKLGVINNNLCFFRSFEVIKMNDYKMINSIYYKLENGWSLKIRFYRNIPKQYKVINSSIYGFWNETAIIYRYNAKVIMFKNKLLFKVSNNIFSL